MNPLPVNLTESDCGIWLQAEAVCPECQESNHAYMKLDIPDAVKVISAMVRRSYVRHSAVCPHRKAA